jgi:hypothetical protein
LGERIKYLVLNFLTRTLFGVLTGALCVALAWPWVDDQQILAILAAGGFVLGFLFGRVALEWVWEHEWWTPW